MSCLSRLRPIPLHFAMVPYLLPFLALAVLRHSLTGHCIVLSMSGSRFQYEAETAPIVLHFGSILHSVYKERTETIAPDQTGAIDIDVLIKEAVNLLWRISCSGSIRYADLPRAAPRQRRATKLAASGAKRPGRGSAATEWNVWT